MSASQSHSPTADKPAQTTAVTVKIKTTFGSLRKGESFIHMGVCAYTKTGARQASPKNQPHQIFKFDASEPVEIKVAAPVETLTTAEYAEVDGTRRRPSFPYDVTINDRRFLRIKTDFTFEVHDDSAIFGPYVVSDTRLLDPVITLLENDAWDELELNAAVEALNQN
jgi:hypothetical protein